MDVADCRKNLNFQSHQEDNERDEQMLEDQENGCTTDEEIFDQDGGQDGTASNFVDADESGEEMTMSNSQMSP